MVFLSMISKLLQVAVILVFLAGQALADDKLSIVYLSRDGDPTYLQQKSYTGLKLKEKHPPLSGVKAAVKEAKIPGRAAGLKFELVEHRLASEDGAADAVQAQLAIDPDRVFILDLPLADIEQLAASHATGAETVMFNIRQPSDALRAEKCSPALFHTIASTSMQTDAVAQFLGKMNWRNVLVLASPSKEDVEVAKAFTASIKKFGLKIAATREFVNSNDPREREKNRPRLLTSGADYDVIFLADHEGEFGRYLAYNTYLPRPVIGAEGVHSSSWHWTWERNGAPQLNQRIRKFAKGNPSSHDWAGWVAVRSVVQAAIKSASVHPGDLRKTLRSNDFTVDMYKIGPGSFRRWDQQLRQPVLLHTHNAVIGTAPFDGFLHRFNTFDTLGFDEAERRCAFAK
jgi:ABC transporter substrate binding protein (PQQ-dependent alcohol dehydrogenase system)